jgi:hypothetical protein
MKKLLLATAALLIATVNANADMSTATFSGHITGISIGGTPASSYGAVGDVASISVIYDSSTLLSGSHHSGSGFSSSTSYSYSPLATWSIQVGASEATAVSGSLSEQYSSFCNPFSCSSSSGFTGGANYFPPNSTYVNSASFSLGFNPSLFFGDPADLSGLSTLLSTAPHAAGGSLSFYFNEQNGFVNLAGNIESYSVQYQGAAPGEGGAPAPVPGPIVGAGLPGLLGMLVLGGWHWQRRKKIA